MASSLDIRVRFGRIVRELRVEQGWSQEQLGERADLHRNYIGGVERGERNISLLNIEKMATAFGVQISDLFDRIGD